MNDKSEALLFLYKRMIVASPVFALTLYLLIPLRVVSIISPMLMVIVGILLSHPLAELVAQPAGSLYNPVGKNEKVRHLFSIAEGRIIDGRYREALELYREMLLKDPYRLEIYLRIIKLAFTHMKDTVVARETLSHGMKNLKKLEERKILSEEYRRLKILYREKNPDLEISLTEG